MTLSSRSTRVINCSRISSASRSVYVARKALVGWESITRVFPQQFSLHHMIAIRSEEETWICDFLPIEPANPLVVIRLLTLGEVPGEIRTVQVSQGLWRDQEEYIGQITDPEFLNRIESFNATWNKSLSLWRNDCRSYVDALGNYLVSKPN